MPWQCHCVSVEVRQERHGNATNGKDKQNLKINLKGADTETIKKTDKQNMEQQRDSNHNRGGICKGFVAEAVDRRWLEAAGSSSCNCWVETKT